MCKFGLASIFSPFKQIWISKLYNTSQKFTVFYSFTRYLESLVFHEISCSCSRDWSEIYVARGDDFRSNLDHGGGVPRADISTVVDWAVFAFGSIIQSLLHLTFPKILLHIIMTVKKETGFCDERLEIFLGKLTGLYSLLIHGWSFARPLPRLLTFFGHIDCT